VADDAVTAIDLAAVHTVRSPRAVERRRRLGHRLRAYRYALGLTARDVAAHIGAGHGQITAVETARQDVYVGTLVDVADAVGLEVALAAAHHLPLLDLTAAEVEALVVSAALWADNADDPALTAALTKLTPTAEEVDRA
jgi:transcriptional regulator with XRE-family HTH domain